MTQTILEFKKEQQKTCRKKGQRFLSSFACSAHQQSEQPE